MEILLFFSTSVVCCINLIDTNVNFIFRGKQLEDEQVSNSHFIFKLLLLTYSNSCLHNDIGKFYFLND